MKFIKLTDEAGATIYLTKIDAIVHRCPPDFEETHTYVHWNSSYAPVRETPEQILALLYAHKQDKDSK